ncbi:hypothetical protein CKO42_04590 [Lamprobacter modestohalophilus]|uniref:Glycosyltransferase subfamily 4-like N-terminal domain-containing protein n=1 Tax=Lamprobacter modestohalophilus TaxID=1064514 RepID=A0A9X1B2T9_9GAMM|nr:glycosyltransferase family 4 protein [Lamprobacter modestohalophilus]MBK1617743.1 hypothetical protein [Lamprobacter modestohalophilus]MCF7994285.1 glycosyltransferase family 4 protein [Chromatiaceae bacterium]MCF8003276.1 glycosyltransferase family 4 protein [Chromatiaceae bacterium]
MDTRHQAARERPLILYLVTVDWFFYSHFVERALAARDAGYQVAVVCRPLQHQDAIESLGIRVIPWSVSRNGVAPWRELGSLLQLMRIYRRERPDLVHHVALKPIVYGGLAASFGTVGQIVNAPVGMGFTFSSKTVFARRLRPMIQFLYRRLLPIRGAKVVFENRDDRRDAIENRLVLASSAYLIRGAGVDLARFKPTPEPQGSVCISLIGRMLKEKGVEEFVCAARKLRENGIDAQYWLVGPRDRENRGSLSERQLRDWEQEGLVTWLGERCDIPTLLAESHIVALPSYREGLPKALLEALAAGRPIITTDVPGCREVCEHGVNGLLVPPGDVDALAEAMRILIQSPAMRMAFGIAGRNRAEREFSNAKVESDTLALYRVLLE